MSATETETRPSGAEDHGRRLPQLGGLGRGSAASRLLAPPVYRKHQWLFLLGVALLASLVPSLFGGTAYRGELLNLVVVNAILALGFWWCFRLAGKFTFAVFAMYALGAYLSVYVSEKTGSFWLGFVAAVLVTALLGGLMLMIFSKLALIYFAIATLGIGGLMHILFREWVSFTGGFNGISSIPPTLFGTDLTSASDRFYLYLAVFGVLMAGTVALVRSPAARDLMLSRDNGPVAATMSLKPRYLTLAAFTVGSGMQGAAGSLFGHNAGYFSLESFNVDISLNVLLMVLLGGIGSIYGPAIGASIIVLLPEFLRDAQKFSQIIYAALVLVIVVAFPTGLAGLRGIVERQVHRARRR